MELSKNLKKIMISSAAILMFASVSASVSSVNVSARHVRTHRARRHNHKALRQYGHKRNVHKYDLKRSKHIKDVHKFNSYENHLLKTYKRLVHLNDKGYKYNSKKWNKNFNKITRINKQTYWQGYNRMDTKAYHQGYRDGYCNVSDKDPYFFEPKYKNNKQYKKGFITAVQYSDLYNAHSYKKALARYKYMRRQKPSEVSTMKDNPGKHNSIGFDFAGLPPKSYF